jgi:amino acid adenylation domain-containing protein
MTRNVSPNERLYLACEPLYPPFLIQLKVSGKGTLDTDHVRAALEKAGEANPGSRLALEGGKWVDTHRSPPLRESPLTHELFHTPIVGSTCEVVINQNEILFRAFHGVMDARGLLLWVEDVFRALRGETLVGATSTMTDREAVLSKKKPREKALAKFASLAQGETSWCTLQLPNDANLVARVAAAITKIANAKTNFMIPVDLRPYFPEVRTTGNFSNPIFIQVEPEESSADVQAHILRKLNSEAQFATSTSDGFLSYVPLAVQRKAIRTAQGSMDSRNRYLVTAVLSNLGRIPLASLSTPTFRAERVVSLPLDTPFCPLTLIMTEHENGTELAISARSPGLVEKIRCELGQEMSGATNSIGQFFDHFKSDDARIAVSQGERKLTYAELDRRSSNVAATLPKVDRIAVQMNHSIELIVALLAVMKSGAAFIPIDPTLPKERIDFIASTAQHLIRELPEARDQIFEPRPGHLAYVLFTSGSTGSPKGVEVSQKSFMNYLEWAKGAYGSGHRSALFTSIGFDLTLTSVFLPLISQGEIRIYNNDPFVSLKELQAENVVTFLKATPSHLKILRPMTNVKTLVSGGEQLTTSTVAQWKTADIFNEYGPTEATVGCVVHKYDRIRDRSSIVPIGRPIQNTRLTIERGELVIEGESVAEGYLNQLKFEKRYRTGDLVQKQGDDFVYLGRADRQLKVNGIRIEPAEIESAIKSHPLVTDAVVGLNSQNQLVAYYKAPEVVDLRDHLETKLSRGLIPIMIDRRAEFPMNSNGKIEFESLQYKQAERALTAAQEKIRSLASEILKRSPLSIPLGEPMGLDSLSLVILLDRLNEPAMFQRAHEFAHDPTVERLAATLTDLENSKVKPDDLQANRRPR